jgi:hypothetical protein
VFIEKVRETRPFVRDVTPVLHPFFMNKDLDTAGDDADVGWDLELFV